MLFAIYLLSGILCHGLVAILLAMLSTLSSWKPRSHLSGEHLVFLYPKFLGQGGVWGWGEIHIIVVRRGACFPTWTFNHVLLWVLQVSGSTVDGHFFFGSHGFVIIRLGSRHSEFMPCSCWCCYGTSLLCFSHLSWPSVQVDKHNLLAILHV